MGIMMISTRGRYALRVMVDLAEHATGAFTPLKEVAERQDISQKYLESIMSNLSKSGFVERAAATVLCGSRKNIRLAISCA